MTLATKEPLALSDKDGLRQEGALTVHSPYRGATKAALVSKLAQDIGATDHTL